ncbi:MAG TPA: tyrosine-type recombinase/integrase [Verrucomicrobiae bacterium]|nr:tyrosine-type recombinase/integrase [Verrucomicrobiae bacterium]
MGGQWADVDFGRGNIRLRMTENGEGRTVPMFPEMRELLARMKQARGDVAPDDTVLLVREAQGFINSACKRLGIPRFTHRVLRAMFGTTCLEAGIDVRTVAEWMGHKDHGSLLLKTCSHIRADHESEMVDSES